MKKDFLPFSCCKQPSYEEELNLGAKKSVKITFLQEKILFFLTAELDGIIFWLASP